MPGSAPLHMRLLQKWALRSNRGKVRHALFLCCQAILWGILDAMRRRPSSVIAGRDSRGSVGEQLTSRGAISTGLLVVRFMLGDVGCEPTLTSQSADWEEWWSGGRAGSLERCSPHQQTTPLYFCMCACM